MNTLHFFRPSILIILTLLFAIGFISGCSTMNGIVSSWEGQHIDSVISQWGYPDEQRDLRGRTLYIWQHNKSFYIPQSSTTTGSIYGNSLYARTSYSGGYTMHGSCTRILEVDQRGCVVRWEWSGNNCPFLEVFGYSNWRNRNNSILGYAAQKGCGCGRTAVPDRILSSEETKKVSEDMKQQKDQGSSVTNQSEKQSNYEPTKTNQKVSTNKTPEEAPVENLGRYSGHKEKCSICGRTIPKLEQHFAVDEKIVCRDCFAKEKGQQPVAKK